MSSNILFSIIIITKSNYKDLLLTLDSVAGLKYRNFEAIVVNGSRSEYTVPESYSAILSLIEINDEGAGIYNAMNLGIDHVTGDYVVFMNAGDQFASSSVLTEIESILKDNDDIDVLCGAAIRIDSNTGRSSIFWPRQPSSLLYGMISCHQSIYYRGDLLSKYKFETNSCISNDWKHLLNISRLEYKLFVTKEIFSKFDINGLSNKKYLKTLFEKWKYARKISQDRAHVDKVYFRKFVKIIRWKFQTRFHGI